MTSRRARTELGFAVAAEFDAGRAFTVEKNFPGLRAGDDFQVGARQIRLDIGARGAPALAIFLGNLVDSETLLLGTVEIVGHRQLELPAGLQEVILKGIRGLEVGNVERAVGAVKRIAK